MEQNDNNIDQYRRRFLERSTAVLAGGVLAPGVFLHAIAQARPVDEAVSGKVRWGMLIDSNKCKTGCDKCVKACETENGLNRTGNPLTDAQWIRKVSLKDKQTGRTASLPLLCQHCAEPPCVDVCPTGASFKRADGIVLVDKHICIGCRYCMMACPYKARSFVHEDVTDQKSYAPRGKGTVESCTFCVHRVDKGESPACVSACEEKAMVFGDMNDPQSELSQLLREVQSTEIRGDLALNLGVRYQGI